MVGLVSLKNDFLSYKIDLQA